MKSSVACIVVLLSTAALANAARVAVLGGGMGGMATALELGERGFEVDVFERYPWFGGKSYSGWQPQPGTEGRLPLPNEHGFRFFAGFYKHVVNTLQRIPFSEFGYETVFDILKKSPIRECNVHTDPSNTTRPTFAEVVYYMERIAIGTGFSDNRWYDVDSFNFWDFVSAGELSYPYQEYMVRNMITGLVAAKPQVASVRTMGQVFMKILHPDHITQFDRTLRGPTSLVWIDPYVKHLESLGVRMIPNTRVHTLDMRADTREITGFTDTSGNNYTDYDYYVAAMPVEKMIDVLANSDQSIRDGSQHLQDIDFLEAEWMEGMQFYLTEELDMEYGHALWFDSPWMLTTIYQPAGWDDFSPFDQHFGDGSVKGLLSAIISDFDHPGRSDGPSGGKPAKACTRKELIDELWFQMHRMLPDQLPADQSILHSSYVCSWVGLPPANPINDTPLLVNTIDSWAHRPQAQVDSIPNLLLAADYVQTNADLATMESADEAGKRAANAILEQEGRDDLVEIYDIPWLSFDFLTAIDERRRLEGLDPLGWDFPVPGSNEWYELADEQGVDGDWDALVDLPSQFYLERFASDFLQELQRVAGKASPESFFSLQHITQATRNTLRQYDISVLRA